MLSYWEKEFWHPKFDFAIIGSGIVGVCCAIQLKLKFPNAKIVILERGELPQGASTKNAGFACFGTIGELLDDLHHQSEQDLISTVKMRWGGLQALRELVPDRQMDYNNLGGTEIVDSDILFNVYENKRAYINDLILEAIGIGDLFSISNQSNSPYFFERSFFNKEESQLNPAKMMYTLIGAIKRMGIEIINGFNLMHYEKKDVFILNSDSGNTISSKRLIFCTNAFTDKFFPDLDIIPARNQVLVTSSLSNLKWVGCHHFDCGYIYFRNIGKRILLGGARNLDHINELTDQFGANEKIIKHLMAFLTRLDIDSEIKIEYQWSGIIATGKSKLPIVKEIEEGVYVGVRLGGMGVAIGSGVAKSIVDLIH